MNLYEVIISDNIWIGDSYVILSYKKFYGYKKTLVTLDIAHSGFYYGLNNNFVFDLDDTYPITDEKFINVTKRLRQLIRDDKLNSLSL